MMPPICVICDSDFREIPREGGLLSFKLTPEEAEFNKRFDERGFTGHPAGLHWFCGKHIDIAKQYTELTSAEALPLIRKDSGA